MCHSGGPATKAREFIACTPGTHTEMQTIDLSGISRVECWRFSDVSENIAVAIFKVNVLEGVWVRSNYVGVAVGDEWRAEGMITRTKGRSGIQYGATTWLRKRGGCFRKPPPTRKTFTMKMATAVFAEKLENFQRSALLIPEGRCYTSKKIWRQGNRNLWVDISGTAIFDL
jgi:hypothetical protein